MSPGRGLPLWKVALASTVVVACLSSIFLIGGNRVAAFVYFMMNSIVWLSAIYAENEAKKSGQTSVQPVSWKLRGYTPRPTNAGRWLRAPIAEIDKSTLGNLLASRMRRQPGLRVVVRPRSTTPEPSRSDALYDAELDG